MREGDSDYFPKCLVKDAFTCSAIFPALLYLFLFFLKAEFRVKKKYFIGLVTKVKAKRRIQNKVTTQSIDVSFSEESQKLTHSQP